MDRRDRLRENSARSIGQNHKTMTNPLEHPKPGTRRGHGPKIQEAVAALEGCGALPRNLRPVHRDSRVLDWLHRNGYAADLPSRAALARYFQGSGCKASKSGETIGAGTDGRTYVGPTTSSRSPADAEHLDA